MVGFFIVLLVFFVIVIFYLWQKNQTMEQNNILLSTAQETLKNNYDQLFLQLKEIEIKNVTLKKENENIKSKIHSVQSILDTRSNKYPPLAKAITNYQIELLNSIPTYLENKKHAARNSAQLARKAIKDAKSYILKFNAAKNLIFSYESLFPWLEEYRSFDIESIEKEINSEINQESDTDDDPIKYYIPICEYTSLSPTERNQKALDRYIESHKSNIQIGRLYERYIGYLYEKKGFEVEYVGAIMGFEDLGRDLIAKKENDIYIIQCKYWSKEKVIRENHICQLLGTTLKAKIEYRPNINVSGILITSTQCSPMAHTFARELNIQIKENIPLENYPMIKCNIGKDSHGNLTWLYHLPMDQMYDRVKIKNKGEFYAQTIQEAELSGFRRAWKWKGE